GNDEQPTAGLVGLGGVRGRPRHHYVHCFTDRDFRSSAVRAAEVETGPVGIRHRGPSATCTTPDAPHPATGPWLGTLPCPSRSNSRWRPSPHTQATRWR